MNALFPIPVAQTALSEGCGPAWADLAGVEDLALLDVARRQHLRRMASDAVDHLIALMDALDAPGEDREPDQDGGDADECDDEDDGTAEPSLGAPERHPDLPPPGYTAGWGRYVDRSRGADQARWASGDSSDREVEGEHDEDGHDREEEHDGREPDVDDEPALGAPEFDGRSDNWERAEPDAGHTRRLHVNIVTGPTAWAGAMVLTEATILARDRERPVRPDALQRPG